MMIKSYISRKAEVIAARNQQIGRKWLVIRGDADFSKER
jgi:hypothetical protein